MNLFKRLTATFTGSLESAVSHFENHEALVQAALKETREAAAKTRVRLDRVRRDGENLRSRLSDLESEKQRWEQRAVELTQREESDEQKALECVRRRNYCVSQIDKLVKAELQHEARETALHDSLRRIDERIHEIEATRNQLRTRQTAAEAQRAAGNLEQFTDQELDDVLERWEMRVVESEYYGPVVVEPCDPFEKEFSDKEDLEQLRRELEQLKSKDGKPTGLKDAD